MDEGEGYDVLLAGRVRNRVDEGWMRVRVTMYCYREACMETESMEAIFIEFVICSTYILCMYTSHTLLIYIKKILFI